mgnify:FL=1
MARVKFIRDEEPNIRSLETDGGAIDGALYVATDTGNMWMGTDKILAGSGNNALLKINGNQVTVFNLVVLTSNNLANVTSQLTYDEIVSDIKAGYEVFACIRPSENENNNNCYVKINLLNGTLRSDLVPIKTLYSGSTATETPLFVPCYLQCDFSNQWEVHSNNPWAAVGFQTFSNSSFTNTNTNGFYALDIKNKSISTDKLADASVTKAKLGSDIVIPTSKADIGLENVDNTADADKSVKYATSAGSANTASVANSVAWDNITGAPTIPIPETTWKDVKTEGQFYKSDEAPSSTTVGKYDGYFYATRVYNAVYNDYAELFHCVRPISVGHLAYATKEGVTCAGKPKTAIGIVSDCYGHLLGGEGDPDDPNFVPIAVAGRVPLEIKGNIEIGDMVQATKNGLGKRAHRFTNRNKIIGKAVGFDPKGRNNYMEVLVGGM